MDKLLIKAIRHLLESISDEEMVDDLLLIEVDWGEHTPEPDDEAVEISFQGGDWPLVFSNSELEFRRALCRSSIGRAILTFPSSDNFKAPRDIVARAHKGTSYRLGLRHRLFALTDRHWPAEVEYAEWRPSVEQHLDLLISQTGITGLNWTITREDLEQQLVKAAFGLEVEGQSAAELLAKLLTYQRRRNVKPATDLEKSLLQGQLRQHQVEWSDVLAWATEGTDRPRDLVLTGVMMDAERKARRMPNWGSLNNLRALLVNQRQLSEDQSQSTVIELATKTMGYLHHETAKSIAREAQNELIEVLPDKTYNRWFPDLLEQACQQVAKQLAKRSADAAGNIVPLQEHLFAKQFRSQLECLSEMAKLVDGWEKQQPDIEKHADVSSWANWYANNGGHLDLSALKLMHQQTLGTGLNEHVEKLLKSFWRWRDGLNERFAREYLSHYETALHNKNTGIFGTHRIFDWLVQPLRQQKRPNPVILIIVDGMGYPAFLHLMEQWLAKTQPVYIQEPGTALALLPSVTSVSRKGLFLTEMPTDRLDSEVDYDRKARKKEEKALKEAFSGERTRFYNKSNLGNGQDLEMDISMGRASIISVILNVIDDELKVASPNVRLPKLEDMGPMVATVNKALELGWSVVMTADHGHTWHRGKELRRGDIATHGGERFMPVAEGDTIPAGAIVTEDPNIVRVQVGKKVALLTATGAYFGRIPRRGYHGGVSLEEVIVPCVFLSHEAPAKDSDEEKPTEAATVEYGPVSYDLSSIILELKGGKTVSLDMPFTLTAKEVRLLQSLARLGEASESELRQALNTRRVAGLVAALTERLVSAGPEYDYIEQKGMGAQGALYRFRAELLP